MTPRPSSRRPGDLRGLRAVALALALLLVACSPAWPAVTPPPGADAPAGLPAAESPRAAEVTPAGDIAAEPCLTPEGFEARGVATVTPVEGAGLPATPTPTGTQSAATPAMTPSATATTGDGLPVVAFDSLPAEARETIRLIDRGGPFPYRQDGSVFQNRERLLPLKPAGYYREYTVRTPGSTDRGARRIVAGAGAELYYTADHYASFMRVVR